MKIYYVWSETTTCINVHGFSQFSQYVYVSARFRQKPFNNRISLYLSLRPTAYSL